MTFYVKMTQSFKFPRVYTSVNTWENISKISNFKFEILQDYGGQKNFSDIS